MDTNKRLTYLSYFIFIFLGCAFISQGILIIYMSTTYGISLAHVGYLFFIAAAMQAVATYFNGYFLDKFNLKTEVIVSLLAMIISFFMIISGSFTLLIIGLIPYGLSCGLLISIPSYLIISMYPESKFTKLNILNFFFSLGGIAGPLILGQLLGLHLPWQLIVVLSCILIVLIALFAYKIPFSYIQSNINEENIPHEKSKWHLSIYLIALAILFYVLSEVTFSTWIVSYLKIKYNFSISTASLGLTLYWLCITFGRFAADKIGKYMKIYQFILGSTTIAFIAYFMVFFFKSPTVLFIMIALMGMGYAGLYASILSYGLDQLKFNDPKLMSFLVLAGTIGNILALPLSSFFVNKFSILTALFFGFLILGLVIAFIYATLKDKNNPAIENRKHRIWGAISRRSKFVRHWRHRSIVKSGTD